MDPFTSGFLPTKIRCMRRVSVNVEANGNRRCCGYMPMGSLYYPKYVTPQEHKFEQMDPHMRATNLVYGLSSHEDPMKQKFDTNLCRVSEVSDLTCESNCVSQETINALKSVISTLECNRSERQGSLYSTDREDRMGSGAALDDNTAGQGSLYSTGITSLNSTDRGGRRRSGVTFADNTTRQGSFCSYQDNCGQNCPDMARNQQLNTLTDLVRQTLFKLDNYMALQAEQQGNQYNLEPYLLPEVPVNVPPCMDTFMQMQMKAKQQLQPPKGRARRTVKVMPVQPLVIMPPAAPQPAPPPAHAPYRPERYRMRPRKRRAAPETAAATATKTIAPKDTKRDSGTTMWCPSRCCQCFCGVNASGGREFRSFTQSLSSIPLHGGYCSRSLTPSQATNFTASLSPSHATSYTPSLSPALSPSQATSFSPSHATSYTPSHTPYLSPSHATSYYPSPIPSRTCSPTPSPNNSFYCAAKKIMRSSGGMKSQLQTCGFPNQEEEEEQDQAQAEANSQEEDDWYKQARHDLDELETQPSNYPKATCDKLLQTDAYDTTSSDYTDKDTESQTSQRCIATTDKAVNTCSDDRKPVKIVRIYKCSTLKSKSKSKKNQSKGENKVRFQGKDVCRPNKSRDQFSNPFLLKSQEELPSSSRPSLSKFRVLKSMSEPSPAAPRRRYSVQEAAKFQRLLEEEQEKLKVPKDFDCHPLRCTCSRHSRCKGGCDRNVELLPTYPSGWSQLSMGD